MGRRELEMVVEGEASAEGTEGEGEKGGEAGAGHSCDADEFEGVESVDEEKKVSSELWRYICTQRSCIAAWSLVLHTCIS